MKRPEMIARQARRPHGFVGWLLGNIMSHQTAPINEAVLNALGLNPNHRVLEVGFGHGRTLNRAAHRIPNGFAAGVDASETMLRMASRRNRAFIKTGRVGLVLGDSSRLPFPDAHFDRAYAVHTLYFWDDPVRHLTEIHRVLRPGGRLVLGFRAPVEGSGTENFPASVYTFYSAEAVGVFLLASGFVSHAPVDAAGLGPGTVILEANS